MKPPFPRINNFDLLRLVAEFQVVLLHAIEHLGADTAAFEHLRGILNIFSGVLIFFFTSGFLVSMSYARSQRTSLFFRNRALRLFPALWVCLFLSIILVWSLEYPIFRANYMKSFVIWIFTQMTMFQFWNPDVLRGFGLGVLNGSLWTISVEIQFYIPELSLDL